MIVIDSNEFANCNIGKKLKKKTKVIVEPLPAGDYWLPSAFEEKESILVERKTTVDLAQSIKTNRWRNQIEKLGAVEKENSVVYYFLLEGDIGNIFKYTDFYAKSIAGVIASILFDAKRTIIPSSSKRFTKILLLVLMNRVQKEKEPKKRKLRQGSPKKKDLDHWARFILEGYPNVGSVTSGDLLEAFGSIENIIDKAKEKKLRQVDGVGEKTEGKIKQISTHLHSLFEFEDD